MFPPHAPALVRPTPPASAREFSRTPVAVVVDDQEWTARSLDSILGSSGYAVLKAYTGRQAEDLLDRVRPDVLFLDLRLPDIDGMTLHRRLLEAGRIDEGTPVIALAPGRLDRDQRLDALGRGAWDVLGMPFDADELVLRLAPLVKAKQAADQIREESLVDTATGLYNTRGVLQKLSELRSAASRSGNGLACIVVGPRDERELEEALEGALGGESGDAIGLRVRHDAGGTVARIWRATRRSDAKGSLGRTLFVVVAPDTDPAGAHRLAERIVEETGAEADAELVAGLFAESDLAASPVTASDFLSRATEAFRRAQASPDRSRILGYGPHAN